MTEEWKESPVAFNEATLLALGEASPDNPGRNLLSVLELAGNVDVPRLHEAFARVIARHENLRTTFAHGAEGWTRRVYAQASPGFDAVDVSGEPDPEASARAAVRALRDTVFDVGALPLARALCVRLGPARSWLVCVCEHVLVDGLGVGVLLGELGALYGALRDPGAGVELPDAPQPAEHVARLAPILDLAEVELARRARARTDEYNLPLDHPRPSGDDHAGDVLRFPLADGAALRGACEAHGWPFAAPLMAALQGALARHAGRPDVAYSLVRAGRHGAEARRILGYLAWGDIIEDTRLPGDRWADVVARAAATLGDRDPVRMLTNTRLAPPGRRVVLNVNRWRLPTTFGDLGVQARFDIEQAVGMWSTHDLFFQVFDSPMGVFGAVRWRRSVLEASTIQRLVGDLRGGLATLIANAEAPVSFG